MAMNGEEQQKRKEEYLEKIREERLKKHHMTEEEFYAQMARSMGRPVKFIKKQEEDDKCNQRTN